MSRAATAAKGGHAATSAPPRRASSGYFEQSELPLSSLVFLLPLIALYEVGTAVLLRDAHGGTQHIIAFNLLQQFFHMMGATGRHLPALAVVGILLAWHIARNDAWVLYPRTYLGMAAESLALAVPLLIMGFVVVRYLQHLHLAGGIPIGRTGGMIVLSIGAGIYEELVFRLVAFTFLSFVLRDLFQLPNVLSGLLIVLVSALAFSAYHYLGNEQFDLPTFAFRTIAGVYFGGMFLARGFGVTAGSHAAYDILVTLLR
ncbi:MAG TPA: CPBP family intramembrane glutamic endopeptidase [Tepidisphaeraceae bacterium]|nr:CPBP family intramembrane glutamic endopeptidase [Tepidisphaeraceae bacterium]